MSLDSDLVKAVYKNDVNRCKNLLNLGASPDSRMTESIFFLFEWCTCLVYAIKHNKFAVAELLIKRGASINETESSECPLFAAAENHEANHILALLLAKGANMQHTSNDEGGCIITVMSCAIEARNANAISMLIDKGYFITDEIILDLARCRLPNLAMQAMKAKFYSSSMLTASVTIKLIENNCIDLAAKAIELFPTLAHNYDILSEAVSNDACSLIRLLKLKGADTSKIGSFRRLFCSTEVQNALDGI